MSEVLIINIWENQVGLYQGAHLELLRTIFEINLELFGNHADDRQVSVILSCLRSQPRRLRSVVRTVLLFVIRDHRTTPLANLERTLTADLAKIWESLYKPEILQDSQITDYFKLVFETLPHKFYATDDFDTRVQVLRKRFVDSQDLQYIFREGHPKEIPADKIPFHFRHIWVRIPNLRLRSYSHITGSTEFVRASNLTCLHGKNY